MEKKVWYNIQQHNIEVNAGIQWSTASFPEEEETSFESYALRRKGDNESIGPTLHSASISLEIKLTERSSSIFLHFFEERECYALLHIRWVAEFPILSISKIPAKRLKNIKTKRVIN